MSKVSTYYGWSNRETWLASLWLSNTQELYAALLEATVDEGSVTFRADRLKNRLVEQLNELKIDSGFWRDLRLADLDKVNWQEVLRSHQE